MGSPNFEQTFSPVFRPTPLGCIRAEPILFPTLKNLIPGHLESLHVPRLNAGPSSNLQAEPSNDEFESCKRCKRFKSGASRKLDLLPGMVQ